MQGRMKASVGQDAKECGAFWVFLPREIGNEEYSTGTMLEVAAGAGAPSGGMPGTSCRLDCGSPWRDSRDGLTRAFLEQDPLGGSGSGELRQPTTGAAGAAGGAAASSTMPPMRRRHRRCRRPGCRARIGIRYNERVAFRRRDRGGVSVSVVAAGA